MKKANNSIVFLTGASGFVGSYLLIKLLSENCKVYALCRKGKFESVERRINKNLKFWNHKLTQKKKNNLIVLEGDITQNNFGLDDKTIKQIAIKTEIIFHCAADTDFRKSGKELRGVNVEGTRRVLDIAFRHMKKHNLRKIIYLSTAYVCGNYKGKFKEDDLDVGQKFNTPYERSKFDAEKIVQRYRKRGLWIDILRPPIIAGINSSGKTPFSSQALYQTLHLLSLGLLEYLPVDGEQLFNIVCIDDLCESMCLIARNNAISKSRNYHIFSPKPYNLRKVIILIAKLYKIRKIKFVSLKRFLDFATPVQKEILKYNIIFLARKAKLDSGFTNEFLKSKNFIFRPNNKKLLIKLLKYVYHNKIIK